MGQATYYTVDGERQLAIQKLRDMAGPSHVTTVKKTIEKHEVSIVVSWFDQIRSFGSGDHFHIAFIAQALIHLYACTIAVVLKSGKRFEHAPEMLEITIEGGYAALGALDLWKISYAEERGTC